MKERRFSSSAPLLLPDSGSAFAAEALAGSSPLVARNLGSPNIDHERDWNKDAARLLRRPPVEGDWAWGGTKLSPRLGAADDEGPAAVVVLESLLVLASLKDGVVKRIVCGLFSVACGTDGEDLRLSSVCLGTAADGRGWRVVSLT